MTLGYGWDVILTSIGLRFFGPGWIADLSSIEMWSSCDKEDLDLILVWFDFGFFDFDFCFLVPIQDSSERGVLVV